MNTFILKCSKCSHSVGFCVSHGCKKASDIEKKHLLKLNIVDKGWS